MSEAIQVVVRCRPFNKKEISEGRGGIITIDAKTCGIFIKNPDDADAPPKQFTFDAVYDENTQQRIFYEESCFGLVESVLEGFNGTIFAYGQTGCGKTWTMQGPWQPPELRGVIPNAFSHIFEFVNATKDVIFLVHCAYLEIYNEEIRDLLADQKGDTRCDLREDPQRGVFVHNLTDVVVQSEMEMEGVLQRGLANRTVGATLMNSESSRSHSIFTIIIEMNYKTQSVNGKDHIKAGKLNLVDLAGSERQKKTGASGDRLKEGSKINLSLSALGNVISALSEGKAKHIPYRDSKLTRLLQDSLGGNTKTLMVAAVSPADYNFDETLSTLRYANRAKSIKNKPKINEDPKDTLLREYREEIERLKKLLEEQSILLLRSGTAPLYQPTGEGLQNAMDMAQQPHMAITNGPDGGAQGVMTQTAAVNGSGVTETVFMSESSEEAALLSARSAGKSPRSDYQSESFASDTPAGAEEGRSESRVMPESPSTAPSNKKSPRKASRLAEGAVMSKEVMVESKIEVVNEEHKEKHKALQEYSESVAKQRDEFGDRLKDKDLEIEEERRKREELNSKLMELQSKLGSTIAGGDGNDGEVGQSEAAKRHRERKAKLKKRMEEKIAAEIQRTQAEKAEVENELEELKAADAADAVDRKLIRLKKKYERQLAAVAQDSEELKEEYSAEKERLLETVREQNREMKLFEQICRAMAADRELKKVLEKAKWNEDNQEWELPFVKAKDLDAMLPSISGFGGSHSNVLSGLSNGSGGSNPNSAPGSRGNVSDKVSPRPSNVVPLPSALTNKNLNVYAGETSPRGFLGVAGINSNDDDLYDFSDPAPRRRRRTKSFKGEIDSDEPSGNSLTSLPVALVPKPPASRSKSQKKKRHHKKKKDKHAQEDDLTDFVTEDEDENSNAGPVHEWGFNGAPEKEKPRRSKTPRLPDAGRKASRISHERSDRSPRGAQSSFESLPHL